MDRPVWNRLIRILDQPRSADASAVCRNCNRHETGGELPKDAIVNRIEINRSMIVAVAAIEQVEARTLRRAQLPRSVGKVWTDEEVQRLKEEFAASEPIPLIATKHSRTVRAIEARLERLGLLTPDQRTTSNSFTGG